MPLYEYKCPNGHVTEELRGNYTVAIRCPICKELAPKQPSKTFLRGETVVKYQEA